jgi:serine/threonine protein kinase
MIGRTLGHYRLVERIGAGGMAEVYRAEDAHLDRDVAIKVLRAGTLANESARKRFRKEAIALSKLNHPNIQIVHDFNTQEGIDFLAVELVPGFTLSEKLEAGPLAEQEVGSLGSQIAAALEEAHERGVVHCDLKPGNIKVTPKGRVKVLDFGIAKLLQPLGVETAATTVGFTDTQVFAGTLPYMAPEQLTGHPVDARTDIWAAGAVLYEMATGHAPFEAKLATALAGDIQHKPVTRPSQYNPKCSPRLEAMILKCLEKKPQKPLPVGERVSLGVTTTGERHR